MPKKKDISPKKRSRALELAISKNVKEIAKDQGVSTKSVEKSITPEAVSRGGGLSLISAGKQLDKLSAFLSEIIDNAETKEAKISDVLRAAEILGKVQIEIAKLTTPKEPEKHLHLHTVEPSELNSTQLKMELARLEEAKRMAQENIIEA